jgi:hypothetical protein
MAVKGRYMAWRVRSSPAPYVKAYGDCVLRDVLPAFSKLVERANEVADAEYQRLGSMPVNEDSVGDMSAAAEAAEEKGQVFYNTMAALRQTTLNLFAAGMFHLVEQQLADLCVDGSFEVPEPTDTKLSVVADWYRRYFNLDLTSLPLWPKIDELRLIANAVKHAEGGAAQRLRKLRPELFKDPSLRELFAAFPIMHKPISLRLPLAGDDFYVTDERFSEYSEAANGLFDSLAGYFEAHAEDLYPVGS